MKRFLRIAHFLLLILVAAAALAGCAQGNPEAAPPQIRYGEDVCAHCGMIITDPRFAAGYAYEVDRGRYMSVAFDDIGDMLVATAETDHTVVERYVHDYLSEAWLDASLAFYVVSREMRTPMGSGIVAFESREAAQALADEVKGEVVGWADLQNHEQVSHAHGH
jgi:copper chaperone NosL